MQIKTTLYIGYFCEYQVSRSRAD